MTGSLGRARLSGKPTAHAARPQILQAMHNPSADIHATALLCLQPTSLHSEQYCNTSRVYQLRLLGIMI